MPEPTQSTHIPGHTLQIKILGCFLFCLCFIFPSLILNSSTLTSEVLIKSAVQLELWLSNKFWWTWVYSFETLLKSTLSDTWGEPGAANGRI